MNSLLFLTAVVLVSSAHAQFEAGFVKILEDQRYQDGAAFGNFRNQEDGIKYKEETDGQGIRTGFWEYPDEHGKIQRVEFEAGPGIGFRITNSNIADKTPISAPKPASRQPQPQPRPQPRPQPIPQARPQPRPQPAAVQPVYRPQPQQPAFQPQPPQQPAFVPRPPPPQRAFVPQPPQQPAFRPAPQQVPHVQPTNLVPRQPQPLQPEPQNLFDYAADLQFFRDAGGHRFKFSAV